VSQLAQLYYVSPTQINYLVPATTALGKATVSVTAPNGVSTAQVNVILTSPGLFSVNSSGLAAGSGVHVRANQQSAFNLSYTDPIFGVQPLPIDLGLPTDRVFLTLYGTGFRNRTSPDLVSATIGGMSALVTYSGAQSE